MVKGMYFEARGLGFEVYGDGLWVKVLWLRAWGVGSRTVRSPPPNPTLSRLTTCIRSDSRPLEPFIPLEPLVPLEPVGEIAAFPVELIEEFENSSTSSTGPA